MQDRQTNWKQDPRETASILVVDDEPTVGRLLLAMLRQLGYSALATSGGAEALRILEERAVGEIELLLTDVNMPLMGGIELSYRTKAIHPEIRVLFMSADPDAVLPEELGAEFIAKGFTVDELGLKVEQALSQDGPRPPWPDPGRRSTTVA